MSDKPAIGRSLREESFHPFGAHTIKELLFVEKKNDINYLLHSSAPIEEGYRAKNCGICTYLLINRIELRLKTNAC